MATFLHVYTYKAISCCWLLLLVFEKKKLTHLHTLHSIVYINIYPPFCACDKLAKGGEKRQPPMKFCFSKVQPEMPLLAFLLFRK